MAKWIVYNDAPQRAAAIPQAPQATPPLWQSEGDLRNQPLPDEYVPFSGGRSEQTQQQQQQGGWQVYNEAALSPEQMTGKPGQEMPITEGVRHVFGNPGSTELPFLDLLASKDEFEKMAD